MRTVKDYFDSAEIKRLNDIFYTYGGNAYYGNDFKSFDEFLNTLIKLDYRPFQRIRRIDSKRPWSPRNIYIQIDKNKIQKLSQLRYQINGLYRKNEKKPKLLLSYADEQFMSIDGNKTKYFK